MSSSDSVPFDMPVASARSDCEPPVSDRVMREKHLLFAALKFVQKHFMVTTWKVTRSGVRLEQEILPEVSAFSHVLLDNDDRIWNFIDKLFERPLLVQPVHNAIKKLTNDVLRVPDTSVLFNDSLWAIDAVRTHRFMK